MTGPRGPLAISSQLMQGTGDRKPGETLAGESEACGKPALRPARRSPFRSLLYEPHGLLLVSIAPAGMLVSGGTIWLSRYAPAPTVMLLPRDTPVHDRASADRDIVANSPAGTTQDHRTRLGLEVLADDERRRARRRRAQGSTDRDSETGLGDRADVDLLRGDGWLALVGADGVAPAQSVSDLAGSGHERVPTGRPARKPYKSPWT